jgi:hypothetical protein
MPRRVAAARTAWGGGVLVSWRYLPIPRKAALLLGFRHLAQAAATARRPDGVVARWGWTADVAHSVSMLGVAVVSRRWRAAALANVVVAAAWARAARAIRPVRLARHRGVPAEVAGASVANDSFATSRAAYESFATPPAHPGESPRSEVP